MEEEALTMVASGSSILTCGGEAGAWRGETDDVMVKFTLLGDDVQAKARRGVRSVGLERRVGRARSSVAGVEGAVQGGRGEGRGAQQRVRRGRGTFARRGPQACIRLTIYIAKPSGHQTYPNPEGAHLPHTLPPPCSKEHRVCTGQTENEMPKERANNAQPSQNAHCLSPCTSLKRWGRHDGGQPTAQSNGK